VTEEPVRISLCSGDVSIDEMVGTVRSEGERETCVEYSQTFIPIVHVHL
jgi:hypothetical protein